MALGVLHVRASVARRAACALAVGALLVGLGATAAPRAGAAPILSDVTCNSVDDRIYFQLPASDYDQWLWYRIWRFDSASRQWYPYFDAPGFYLQQSWNTVGTIGGGGGPGTIRGGFLTYVTMSEAGYYYVAAWVAYASGNSVAGYRYEYVGDYSNVDYYARDRRVCWIG